MAAYGWKLIWWDEGPVVVFRNVFISGKNLNDYCGYTKPQLPVGHPQDNQGGHRLMTKNICLININDNTWNQTKRIQLMEVQKKYHHQVNGCFGSFQFTYSHRIRKMSTFENSPLSENTTLGQDFVVMWFVNNTRGKKCQKVRYSKFPHA